MAGYSPHGRSIEPASVAVSAVPDSRRRLLIVFASGKTGATQAPNCIPTSASPPRAIYLALVDNSACSCRSFQRIIPRRRNSRRNSKNVSYGVARTRCRFLASLDTGGPQCTAFAGVVSDTKSARIAAFTTRVSRSPSPAQRRTRSSAIRQSFGANRDSGLIYSGRLAISQTTSCGLPPSSGWAPTDP